MRESTQPDWFALSLQLATTELEWEIDGIEYLAPDEITYLINPRRLRGSDFLMRWAQGRWSEEVLIRALNQTEQFGVMPYGPSTVAPKDPKELELFFEKMDVIAQEGKRPDLLLFDKDTFHWAGNELERRMGNLEKMAEVPSASVRDIIVRARAALEVENSLWVTEKMPGFGKPFTRYLRGRNKAYILCKEFGVVVGPSLVPKTFVDKNGKVMTYVTFVGGELTLSPTVFEEWAS